MSDRHNKKTCKNSSPVCMACELDVLYKIVFCYNYSFTMLKLPRTAPHHFYIQCGSLKKVWQVILSKTLMNFLCLCLMSYTIAVLVRRV
jgi:hypothetical protein